MTFFDTHTCIAEFTDGDDRYFLSCRDKKQECQFNTINTDYIITSLKDKEDFCNIILNPWYQSVYNYGQKISEEIKKHQDEFLNVGDH